MPRQTEKWAEIERDPNVTEGHPDWTEGKEQASQIIQRLIDSGEWPVPLTKLDDETEWSRSHFKNTLRDCWKQVDETQGDKQIKIPDDVNEEDYLRGWINGRQSAK